MNKRPGIKTVWTEEMDAQLRALVKYHTRTEIAAIMGLTWQRVANRAKALGLGARSLRYKYQPDRKAWIACARAAAKAAGVATSEILVGERRHPVARARWTAFKTCLDENPNVSIAGLSRVAGFDHTTILHGLARLRDGSRERATGRRAVPIQQMQEAA